MKTISRYIMTLALLLTAVGGAWAADTKYTVTFKANGNTKTVENVTLPHTFGCNWNDELGRGTGELDVIIQELYGLDGGTCASNIPESDNASVTCDVDNGDNQYIIVNAPFNGTATVTGVYFNSSFDPFIYSLEISFAEPPIEVTTNAASEQDLFTEAWFNMPTFDATVNYMLVRDMQDETNPVAFSGLPTNDEPIIVKKGDDGKYQPAEALTIQLIDPLAAAEAQNIIAADGITIKVEKKDNNTWTALAGTFADFMADMQPGTYRLTATPKDETSPYEGTVTSGEFTLVEKYDLLVKPANDFSKGKIESVTVGSGSVTIYANTGKATVTNVAPGAEVKLKAKRGYVIDKVEAKKGIAPPDPVTVTWNNLNFNSNPYTRDGVTLTAGNNSATGNAFYNYGDKTFTNTLGKFTKIEIVCEGNNFNGWAKESAGGYQIPEGPYVEVFRLTWTGNAESVTIPGGNYIYGISSITFTIQ